MPPTARTAPCGHRRRGRDVLARRRRVPARHHADRVARLHGPARRDIAGNDRGREPVGDERCPLGIGAAGTASAASFLAGTDHSRTQSEFFAFSAESPLVAIVARLLRSQRVWLYEDSVLVKEPGTAREDGVPPGHGVLPPRRRPGVHHVGAARSGRCRNRRGAVRARLPSPRRTRFRPNLFVTSDPIPGTVGEVVPDFSESAELVSFDTEPGDITVHHARTIHGAYANDERDPAAPGDLRALRGRRRRVSHQTRCAAQAASLRHSSRASGSSRPPARRCGPRRELELDREREVVDDAVAERGVAVDAHDAVGARVRARPAPTREPGERAPVESDASVDASRARRRATPRGLRAAPTTAATIGGAPSITNTTVLPGGAAGLLADDVAERLRAGCAPSERSATSPSRNPGRSSASRMSWSWYQQSNTRIAMNCRYGPGPSGVKPSASHSSVVMARSMSSRRAVTARNSSSSFGAVPALGSRDPLLVRLADVVAHVRCVDGRDRRPSAGRSPASMRSVPIMWATLSNTVQPGHSVGVFHCSAVRPSHTSAMSLHTSSNGDQRLGHARTVPRSPDRRSGAKTRHRARGS